MAQRCRSRVHTKPEMPDAKPAVQREGRRTGGKGRMLGHPWRVARRQLPDLINGVL